jgi:Rv2525c-like, glycoside hydrolase-like domain
MPRIRRRHGLARAITALLAGFLISGILRPAVPAAAAVAHHGLRSVRYLGNSFEIPRDWRVIDLRRHPRSCVRFDRHVLYLGVPPRDQDCPSLVIGTTEAMLIAPAPRHAAHISAENRVDRRITIVTRRMSITATFGAHPGQIHRILASDHLPRPVPRRGSPGWPGRASGVPVSGGERRPAHPAWLLPGTTDFHGAGFDTCAAPSAAVMAAWRHASPYRAIGIYIGGSDEACAQPNLTASWLSQQAAAGWHFIPVYAGPQAAFGELGRSPGSQGAAAAADAVTQARRLGFGPRAPLYYDMEAYLPRQADRALQFLAAWTTTLHSRGYSAGVYSSSGSGVADLARQSARGGHPRPDVIFDAWWNGQANTRDPVIGSGEWAGHRRLHQYRGNVQQSFGGAPMAIDQDYLDVQLAPPVPSPPPSPTPTASGTPSASPTVTPRPSGTPSPSPSPTAAPPPGGTPSGSPAVTQPDGTVDLFYRGADGRLWYQRHAPGRDWTSAVDLGGQLASQPSAVAVGQHGLRIFYRGTDGFLWQVRTRRVGWTRPWALRSMGLLGGNPRAVTRPGGAVLVFWRDPRGGLSYAEHRQAVGWTARQSLGGSVAADPAPVISSPGVVQVFWADPTGALWHATRGLAGQWGSPATLRGARLSGSPQAAAGPGGAVRVFWVDDDGTGLMAGSLTVDGHWRGPYRLGGGHPSSPLVPAVAGGRVRAFFRGAAGRLWRLSLARAGQPDVRSHLVASRVGLGPFVAVDPAGRAIDVFWGGLGGDLWWLRMTPAGRTSGAGIISGPVT